MRAKSALQVDLLGIHVEGLVEAADFQEGRSGDEQGRSDEPIHGDGGSWDSPGVVADGFVESRSIAEPGEWGEPFRGVVGRGGEMSARVGRATVVAEDERPGDGGLPRRARRDQIGNEGRPDVEIRVEDQHEVPGRGTGPRVDRRAETAIYRPRDNCDSLDGRELGGGGIVHHDDFVVGLAEHGRTQCAGWARVAIVRDDDTDHRVSHHCSECWEQARGRGSCSPAGRLR